MFLCDPVDTTIPLNDIRWKYKNDVQWKYNNPFMLNDADQFIGTISCIYQDSIIFETELSVVGLLL